MPWEAMSPGLECIQVSLLTSVCLGFSVFHIIVIEALRTQAYREDRAAVTLKFLESGLGQNLFHLLP